MHRALGSAPDAYTRPGQLWDLAALLGLQGRRSEIDAAIAEAALCQGDARSAGPLIVTLALKGYRPAWKASATLILAKDAASTLQDNERHLLLRHALIFSPDNKVHHFLVHLAFSTAELVHCPCLKCWTPAILAERVQGKCCCMPCTMSMQMLIPSSRSDMATHGPFEGELCLFDTAASAPAIRELTHIGICF